MQQSVDSQTAPPLANDPPNSYNNNGGGPDPASASAGGPISCMPCIDAKMLKWMTWAGRLAVFLIYFSISIVLANNLRNRPGCFVQHTYHQDFMANVVSNPMYTSSAVVRDAPVSMLESDYYDAPEIHQRTSDIAMFPNVLMNPIEHAGFLSVLPYPQQRTAAGEVIPATPAALDNNTFYYNPATKHVVANGMGPQGGVTAYILNTMLSDVRGEWRPGMQMPNLRRCIDPEKLPSEEQIATKSREQFFDWFNIGARLQRNSHLRGTCLLNGVQGSVDMTSNYRTSAILFSSVNVMFMVALITWITASFSLFYIGSHQMMSPEAGDSAICWHFADIIVIVSMTWNFLGIIFILMPEVRVNSSIPANNAIIGVVALVVTMLVQWRLANFYKNDVDTIDQTAKMANEEEIAQNYSGPDKAGDSSYPSQQDGVLRGIPVVGSEPQGMPSAPEMPLQPAGAAAAAGGGSTQAAIFSTANFLSTASAVRSYGVEYARQMADSASSGGGGYYNSSSGLRRRNGHAMSVVRHGNAESLITRGQYARMSQTRRMSLKKMPNYVHMITMGTPFAQDMYMKILKHEMFDDSVQCMEYTITTPLLFAVAVVAASPSIPTGMVQWVYGSLLASHILTIPVLYLTHHAKLNIRAWNDFKQNANAMAIGCFLVACAIMQLIGLSICGVYFTSAGSYFHTDGRVTGLVISLLIMQSAFVLAVVVNVIIGLFSADEGLHKMTVTVSSWIYVVLNMAIKIGVAYTLADVGRFKAFPVLTCNVWTGGFFLDKF